MEKDDLLDDTSSSDSEEEVDSEKKLSSIFNDAHATTFLTDDGKKRWRCEWCKKDFAAWNATKALYHLTKKKKVDIAPCQARIDQASMARYVGLLQKKKEKSDRITRKRDLVENSINSKNDRAAVSLESSKRRKKLVATHLFQVLSIRPLREIVQAVFIPVISFPLLEVLQLSIRT